MTSARDRVFLGGNISGRGLGALGVFAVLSWAELCVCVCVLRCLLFASLRIPVTFRLSAVRVCQNVVMAASFGVPAGK